MAQRRWHFANVTGLPDERTRCGKRAASVWFVSTYQEWALLAVHWAPMCSTCVSVLQEETGVPEHLRQWARVH